MNADKLTAIDAEAKRLGAYRATAIAGGWEDADSEEEFLAAWQYLVDTGLAWRLEGTIGRTAADLIRNGHIAPAKEPGRDYWGNQLPSDPAAY